MALVMMELSNEAKVLVDEVYQLGDKLGLVDPNQSWTSVFLLPGVPDFGFWLCWVGVQWGILKPEDN